METYGKPASDDEDYAGPRRYGGLTPIEILMGIVLLGILSGVAVVGLNNLVSRGRKSACSASADASRLASHIYFASNGNRYPINFKELITDRDQGANGTTTAEIPAALTLSDGVSVNVANTVPPAPPALAYMQVSSGTNWYLTMALVSGGAPTFTCSP